MHGITLNFSKNHKITPAFRKSLLQLWNNCYTDLYDTDYQSNPLDLLDQINDFLKRYFQIDGRPITSKYWHIAHSLSCSTLPHLRESLPKKEFEIYRSIELLLSDTPPPASLLTILKNAEVSSGVISESVHVIKDFINFLSQKYDHETLLEIIDGCLMGSALCHGADDKRKIFKWFLQEVLVKAFSNESPSPLNVYENDN